MAAELVHAAVVHGRDAAALDLRAETAPAAAARYRLAMLRELRARGAVYQREAAEAARA